MKITLSSTETVRNFGDCLSRIKFRGDSFLITRNDEPVAELVPASGSRRGRWGDLVQELEDLPYESSFAADLEKVNRSDRIPANPWD